MNTITTQWRCNECGECHNYECDARDCCRPSVSLVYLCPVCDEKHDDERTALGCCPEPESDEPRQLTSAELEAQGQRRLAGV